MVLLILCVVAGALGVMMAALFGPLGGLLALLLCFGLGWVAASLEDRSR